MPVMVGGQEQKSGRRWTWLTAALAVLGLLLLPGILLLALITVPLTEPYLWTASNGRLEVIGVDYRPKDETLGLLIPAGFSHRRLPQFGNAEHWGFRWGKRAWLIERY